MKTPALATVALVALGASSFAQQKLFTAPGSATGGMFAQSLCLIGDLNGDVHFDFVVGAPEDSAAGEFAGRVVILSGTNGAILREHLGAQKGDRFGAAVCSVPDTDGDNVNEYVVGAPNASPGGLSQAGQVKLFSGKTGALVRTWNGAAAGDHFGSSLSPFPGAASAFVVGAPDRDAGALFDAGAVYLFTSASTVPVHEYQGGAAFAHLGASVEAGNVIPLDTDGVGGGDIAAGAPGWSTGATNSGRVQILQSTAPFGVIRDIDGSTAFGRFGASIAALGDVNGDLRTDLAIGEPGGGPSFEGRAYIVSGATGVTLKTLAIAAGQTGDSLGWAVAFGGDFDGDGKTDALVGAPFRKVGSHFNAGSVVAFSSATGAEVRTFDGGSTFEMFGAAIRGGFSFDFTVFNDLLVGAPLTFNVGERAGAVVQLRGATGVTLWTDFGPVYGDHVGTCVGDVGDCNGDGVPDWGVGAPDVPKVELYSGANGFKFLTMVGGVPSANTTLVGVGDLDLDGVPDFAVGAPDNTFGNGAGSVTVFSGTGTTALWNFGGTQAGDRYGAALAAGDLDLDGVNDVIIGAPKFNSGPSLGVGRVEARSGKTGLSVMTVTGNQAGAELGFSVAALGGDLGNDGFTDVITGAPALGSSSGAVYVLTPPSTMFAIFVDPTNPTLGYSVAATGDLDGDGVPDFVAGAPSAAFGFGRVVAFSCAGFTKYSQVSGSLANEFLGRSVVALADLDLDGAREIAAAGATASGPAVVRLFSGKSAESLGFIPQGGAGSSFGTSMARMGDVDADGIEDLLIGAPHSNVTVPDGGAAFVYSMRFPGLMPYGTGTTGCAGTHHLLTNKPPKINSPTLELRSDHAPASSLGLGLISSLQDANGTDFYGVGALLHVGILGATFFDGVNFSSDAAGHGAAAFPIPNYPTLVGVTLYLQSIWAWSSGCSLPPFGLSTSKGLALTILP